MPGKESANSVIDFGGCRIQGSEVGFGVQGGIFATVLSEGVLRVEGQGLTGDWGFVAFICLL